MREKCYVIIGTGAAGVTAAEVIRQEDPDGRIILLSKERELPYARPMLSKAPLLSLELKKLPIHSAAWYQEQQIELRLGAVADGLDTERKLVSCGGETLSYDKCILATGANNFVPPFQGRENVTIYGIRTKDDLRRVRRVAGSGKKVVIIGGGVIGLEMAAELSHYGLEVTVLEAMEQLMPRLINRGMSDWLCEQLPKLHIVTGVSIQSLRRDGEMTVVEEKDGRTWACDFLIVSCGVRADIALAQSAGIACERGIVVDEHMETSAKDVYACGDCAQFQGFSAALWSQGQSQGTVAGSSAAGVPMTYTGCDTSLILNLDGVAIFALGDLGQRGGEEYRIEESSWEAKKPFQVDLRRPAVPGRGVKVWKNDRLVGVALLGDLTKMHQWKKELAEQGRDKA